MGQTNRKVIFLSVCANFCPSTALPPPPPPPPPLPSKKKKEVLKTKTFKKNLKKAERDITIFHESPKNYENLMFGCRLY